jgi:uncharacterized Ntn-hydrolase superfamily protein
MARPHGTYSIVAFDPATGEHGVAVQSHWFSVGSLCPWARPGVGAVATQSVVQPAFGPAALDAMAAGADADAALAAVLATDELTTMRQVGIVDGRGGTAVHTGEACIAEAGHALGEHWSCQANMMATSTIPAAMAAAFGASTGDLADRLMVALEAAEAEGGDVRGRQSAALLVVPATGEPWRTRVDLRVEDHDDPLGELTRLVALQRAYALAGEGDELMAEGRDREAADCYVRAAELAPGSDELGFWAGLAIAHAGDVTAGAAAVRRAGEVHPGWLTLLGRLSIDVAPAAPAVRSVLESKRLKKSADDVDDRSTSS